MTDLRRDLNRVRFPDDVFYFQPGDMITQYFRFRQPSRLTSRSTAAIRRRISRWRRKSSGSCGARGAVDVHIQQITNAPEFFDDVDRPARRRKLGSASTDRHRHERLARAAASR